MKFGYGEVIAEFVDLSDYKIARSFTSLTEAEQDQVLLNIAVKLYDSINNKVIEIDYGKIPESKGDIEKVPNFKEIVECLNTIRDLLMNFKQSTEPVDVILNTIDNMKKTKRTWEKAFHTDNGYGQMMYNNIVLSIVAATSLLVSTCIDYIKEPGSASYAVMIDKASLSKTKDAVLYRNLYKINRTFMDGSLIKSVESMGKAQTTAKQECFSPLDEALEIATIATVLANTGALLLLVKTFLPLLQELTSWFYSMRQSVADYFEIQSKLLELNALSLTPDMIKTNVDVEVVRTRQKKVADVMRKISNAFKVKMKNADKNTRNEINAMDKISPNEILPSMQSSSIF